MGRPPVSSVIPNHNHAESPSSNSVHEGFISRRTHYRRDGFLYSALGLLRRIMSGKKIDGGSRTEEEEKVYSWLYSLARSDKDIVFEYVHSTERGLSFAEAERRLQENGLNVPFDYSFPSWWQLLWNAFFHPFNIILIVLSVLSYIASDSPNGCIMLVLVFISVSLRFYQVRAASVATFTVYLIWSSNSRRFFLVWNFDQEFGSSKAAMKLSEFVRCPVKVQRCAGRLIQTELVVQVDQKDVVPGDIVIFEPGDLFPGDVRLLSSKHLVVSQSSLTGESGTTEKVANIKEANSTPLLDLRNICFMGTNVISGSGTGLVVSTGSKTYMSTMFLTIGKQRPPDDFERGVRRISYVLVGAMLVVVTIIISTQYLTSHDLSESVLFGISVACALTPQMLPLVVNTSLAKGALAMAKDRCIVKNLTAIRDMGSMDILCIDKTGTLTMDRAILTDHLDGWGKTRDEVLQFAFLNSYFKTDQKYPLDDAILAYVYTNGYKFQPSKWIKVDEIPFDFIRRRVSVIIEKETSSSDASRKKFLDRYMVTKGALQEVMKVCSFIERIDAGAVTEFTSEECQRVLNLGEEVSNEGLRSIGVAVKRLRPDETVGGDDADEMIESEMVLLGLITFFDPPKDSAKEALWSLAEKGVKAKLLTGDSLALAIKVCKEVGIRTSHVITGPDLELLDHDSFHETVQQATVLARLTPTQKLRVVQSLQTIGNHVVGFLGDGINDSLALDAANVGISVDSGVSVAKDFSDIILLEKDLNVLVAGVDRGRITLGNTMKYIKMSVIANVGSVISLLIATLLLRFEPLTPIQLLMQNFLYSIGQIAIPWDKMEEDYIKVPQRWSTKGLLKFILWNAPVCTLCDVTTLLFYLFYYQAYLVRDAPFFRSGWFVEGLLLQTLIIHLVRTEKIPFIQEIASWPVLLSTVVISVIGIVIPFTAMGRVMGFAILPLSFFGFLVLLFVGYFSVGQIVKRIYILAYKKWL